MPRCCGLGHAAAKPATRGPRVDPLGPPPRLGDCPMRRHGLRLPTVAAVEESDSAAGGLGDRESGHAAERSEAPPWQPGEQRLVLDERHRLRQDRVLKDALGGNRWRWGVASQSHCAPRSAAQPDRVDLSCSRRLPRLSPGTAIRLAIRRLRPHRESRPCSAAASWLPVRKHRQRPMASDHGARTVPAPLETEPDIGVSRVDDLERGSKLAGKAGEGWVGRGSTVIMSIASRSMSIAFTRIS
jgi:hypothetical protein